MIFPEDLKFFNDFPSSLGPAVAQKHKGLVHASVMKHVGLSFRPTKTLGFHPNSNTLEIVGGKKKPWRFYGKP